MTYLIFQLIVWSLLLYLCHRLAHIVPFLWKYHQDHHLQIYKQTNKGHHWSNYFLFFDTWRSTIDQWLIEIIPTILLCLVFQDFTVFIIYYVWAVCIQERVEHNYRFDVYPFLTSGKWHLVHHSEYTKNFGVFTPVWDILFKTYKAKS
jgi:sterol desaturase/sphingolipid hydroxylase (fatty acid hydroxylase superfamily)